MPQQLGERIERVNPRWFTAAFWLIIAVSIYSLLGISGWQPWLLIGLLGGVANYGWWLVRRPKKRRLLFAITCGLIAAGALASAGYAVLTPFSISTESVGDNRVACGSIVSPIPSDNLHETDGKTGQLVVRERPIPQSEFERVCKNRMNHRTGTAVGCTVIVVLLAVRATGHARTRRTRS